MKLIEQLKVLNSKNYVIIKVDDNDIYKGQINRIPSDFLMRISNYEVCLLDSRREKILFGLLPDEITYIIYAIKK